MGNVTEITDSKMTVKTTIGKSQAVLLTATIKDWKGKAASSVKEIKVDDHTVIHSPEKGTDFVAFEVRTGSMKVSTWANHTGGSMDSSRQRVLLTE